MASLRLALVTAVLAGLASTAVARPPPPPEEAPVARRPLVEWSTWVRLAYGPEAAATSPAQRAVATPAPPDRATGWEAGAGADFTLPIGRGGDLRIGPWIEARTRGPVAVGGELVVAAVPAKLDMFLYEGQGVLVVRGGSDGERLTGAIAYGYRAPWELFRPARGPSRYMIGVRLVATATRAVDDPRDWTASFGIEAEPVGALRYLLGIRSWY